MRRLKSNLLSGTMLALFALCMLEMCVRLLACLMDSGLGSDSRSADSFLRSLDQKDVLFVASILHLERCRAMNMSDFTRMFEYVIHSGKPEGAIAGPVLSFLSHLS